MEGDFIKVIVFGALVLLSWLGNQIEKRGKKPPAGARRAPRGKDPARAQAARDQRPPSAQRAKPSAAPQQTPPPAAEVVAEPRRGSLAGETPLDSATGSLSSHHLESHLGGGLEGRHMDAALQQRHLSLDVMGAREGHAAILVEQQMVPGGAEAAARGVMGASPTVGAQRLPARLTELQRALVWTEVLGRPIALRDPGGQSGADRIG